MSKNQNVRISGSIFAMLFGAVAVVGVIGVSANTLIRGPMSSMSEITRRTVAENSMMASARLTAAMSPTQQASAGDCDADGYVEPLPFRDAGTGPKPTGGGYLPTTVGASLLDPWNTEYGYCVWDHGAQTVSSNVPACGGSGARRLNGGNTQNYITMAVISAGKDRSFQTTCNAFVDANADTIPDTPLVNKPAGSNDIVMTYTYAEAMDIAGVSLWRKKDAATADIDKDVEIRSSSNAVTARIEKETGIGQFNSIYTDNIHRRAAPQIAIHDQTVFLANVGIGANPPSYKLDVRGGSIYTDGTFFIQNGAPTISMLDVDGRSSALHTNSNIFYLLTAPNNSSAWATNGSYWPLSIDLTNDTTSFGGPVTLLEGGLNINSGGINMNAGHINLNNQNIMALYGGTPQTIRDANGGWVRTYGDTGWYNGTHGGGWNMTDSTYIRSYGNKPVMMPMFYDQDVPSWYVDPGGISIVNDMRPTILYDANNYGYYIDMNNYSYVNHLGGNRGDFDIVYDRNNTGYYLDMNNTSNIENLQANIMYDRYNTGYYVQPRGTSVFNVTYAGFTYDLQSTSYYWDGNGTSSNNVIYAHAYYYHSDERKKKNIVSLAQTDLDKLYQLRGVNFDWIESGKHDIGLIAQEVQKVFPELVSELREGELGVKYGNLVPLLLEAAKAQKAEITALQETVMAQEERLKSVEAFMQETLEEKRKQAAIRAAFEEKFKEAQKNNQIPPVPTPPVTPPVSQPASPPVTQPVITPPTGMAPPPTGLVARPDVDMDKVPVVSDISICPKAIVPACLSKESLSNAEEFSCRTEMSAYMFAARLYNLCARSDKDALRAFHADYDSALEKSIAKGFDMGDTALENVAYTHVIALERLTGGMNAAAAAGPDPALRIPPPLPPDPDAQIPPPTPFNPQNTSGEQGIAPSATQPVTPPAVNTALQKPVAANDNTPQTKPVIATSAKAVSNDQLKAEILKWLPFAGIAGAIFVLFIFIKSRARKN